MSREVARAIFKGDIEKIDSFLQEGLDINMVTEKESWNFLHRAMMLVSRQPDSKMIKHLIEKGVDVDARDCYGNTPLYYAARLKNPELIRMLLDAGCEIDPVNKDGITPLRETLLEKPTNMEAIELLLSRGADMEHSREGGATVKEYAKTISHGSDKEIFELFEKY